MAFRWWDLTFFWAIKTNLFGGGDNFYFVKIVHKSLIYIRLRFESEAARKQKKTLKHGC